MRSLQTNIDFFSWLPALSRRNYKILVGLSLLAVIVFDRLHQTTWLAYGLILVAALASFFVLQEHLRVEARFLQKAVQKLFQQGPFDLPEHEIALLQNKVLSPASKTALGQRWFWISAGTLLFFLSLLILKEMSKTGDLGGLKVLLLAIVALRLCLWSAKSSRGEKEKTKALYQKVAWLLVEKDPSLATLLSFLSSDVAPCKNTHFLNQTN